MVSRWKADSIIAVRGDVVSCELENEVVLLDLGSSSYFRMNEVGFYIWAALSEPKSITDLQKLVMDAFDVDPDECARDIDGLILTLANANLVEILDETDR